MSSAAVEETRRLEEASDWLLRLQEDRVPDDELVRWIDWCEAHPENRAAFERLLPLWQAFDDRKSSRSPARSRLREMPRWTIAATVALTFLGAMTVYWINTSERLTHLPPIAQLQSSFGVIRPAILPDGSMLELGARSSIAIDFAGHRREIDLGDGEAFFTVKPDRARPFIVHAGAVQITAVGTRFNVLKSAHRVVITVQEGAVKVDSSPLGSARPTDESPGVKGSSAVLAPAGYQVIYETQSTKPSMRAIDPASSIAWRQGHLEYISEPLSAIIATLNRYSATTIVLEQPTLSDFKYTGTIEVSSIDEWIRALPRIFPVQIQTGPDHELRIAHLK